MKIPNKREPQQITFNHSLDIEYKHFYILKKINCKTNFFLEINTTFASDNHFFNTF